MNKSLNQCSKVLMIVGMLQLLHGEFTSDDVYIVYVWTCSREEVLRHAAAAAAAVWSGPADRRRGSTPPSHDVLFERQHRGKEPKRGGEGRVTAAWCHAGAGKHERLSHTKRLISRQQ